jgi:hypothetical protein
LDIANLNYAEHRENVGVSADSEKTSLSKIVTITGPTV